jgi:hypothetical protein
MHTQTTFVAAARDYFGYRPGQSLSDFNAELKALTEQDKAELIEGLRKEGYPIA